MYEVQCYQIVDETTVPVSNLPYLVPNLYTDCIDCANQNILASQCPTPTPTTTPLPTLSPTFTPTNSVTPTQTKPIVYKTVDTIIECPGSTFEGVIFNFNIPDDGISWGALFFSTTCFKITGDTTYNPGWYEVPYEDLYITLSECQTEESSTPCPTQTATVTPSITSSQTPSVTPSITPTITPTNSNTPTNTLSITPTNTTTNTCDTK